MTSPLLAVLLAAAAHAAPAAAPQRALDYGLVVDVSAAGRSRLNDFIEVGSLIVKDRRDDDRGFVVAAGDREHQLLVVENTSDKARMIDGLRDLFIESDKPGMWDGLFLGVAYFDQKIGPSDRPRVLVALTSGQSLAGWQQKTLAKEFSRAGVSLFVLVAGDSPDAGMVAELKALAAATGGRLWAPKKDEEAAALRDLLAALKTVPRREKKDPDMEGTPADWARAAVLKAYPNHYFRRYIEPAVIDGDFDGDGVKDQAFLVQESLAKKRGVAVAFGSKDGKGGRVALLGSSVPFGNGGDDFSWMDHWEKKKRGKRDALLLEKKDSAGGLAWWDASKKAFDWEQAGD